MGRAFGHTNGRPPSNDNKSKKVNGVPLIVTYNPALNNLSQAIGRNLDYMQTDG